MSWLKGHISMCDVVIKGGVKSTARLPESRRRAAAVLMATVIVGIAK